MCVRVFVLTSLVGVMFTTPSVQASHEAVANFNNGNSSEMIDAYPGMTDDSTWLSEWTVNTSGTPTITNQVVSPGDSNYNEIISGMGAYLDTVVTSTEATRFVTGRQFGSSSSGDLDLRLPYTVDFTVRLNDLSTFNAYTDRLLLFGSAAGRNTTGTSDSWSIFGFGAAEGNIPEEMVAKWAFYNGSANGSYDVANQVNTNVPLVSGGVYDFSIYVDPLNRLWDATVNDGVNSFSAADLGWRGGANPGWIYFGGRTDGVDSVGYSVDSVRIFQSGTVGDREVVSTHFTGGNTDTMVDAFPGQLGDGWVDSWTHGMSDAEGTATVISQGDANFNELRPGGGAYLSVETDHNETASLGCVRRDYKGTKTGIDWTDVHSIQFTVRIDEDLSVSYNAVDDRYQFSDVNTDRNNAYSGSTWMISSYGGEGSLANAEDVGVWTFYDGLRDSGSADPERNIASTITVVTGGVYDFTIVVDPETQSYDVTISDGTNTFTAERLGWRTTATQIGGKLLFGTRSDADDDYRGFSLDSLIITQGNVNDQWDLPGDANKDGKVDGSDVTILANHWQEGVGSPDPIHITWEMGDFNGDGQVDGSDVTILANHWQEGVTSAAVSVPEPEALVLMLSAFICCFMIRRRIVK